MKERFIVKTLHCADDNFRLVRERTSVAESRVEAVRQFELRRDKEEICEGSKQSIRDFLENTDPLQRAVSIITGDWGRYIGFILPVTD